jgi:hypothetical protein
MRGGVHLRLAERVVDGAGNAQATGGEGVNESSLGKVLTSGNRETGKNRTVKLSRQEAKGTKIGIRTNMGAKGKDNT